MRRFDWSFDCPMSEVTRILSTRQSLPPPQLPRGSKAASACPNPVVSPFTIALNHFPTPAPRTHCAASAHYSHIPSPTVRPHRALADDRCPPNASPLYASAAYQLTSAPASRCLRRSQDSDQKGELHSQPRSLQAKRDLSSDDDTPVKKVRLSSFPLMSRPSASSRQTAIRLPNPYVRRLAPTHASHRKSPSPPAQRKCGRP
jgi:hypothetical protein